MGICGSPIIVLSYFVLLTTYQMLIMTRWGGNKSLNRQTISTSSPGMGSVSSQQPFGALQQWLLAPYLGRQCPVLPVVSWEI